MTFGDQSLTLNRGTFSNRVKLSLCALPSAERLIPIEQRHYGSSFYRDLGSSVDAGETLESRLRALPELERQVIEAELRAIDAQLANNDPVELRLLARASVFEEHEMSADALETYKQLAGILRRIPWVLRRAFYHDDLSMRRRPPGSNSTYALLVGVSNYESKEIPRLEYADDDARSLWEFLQLPGSGKLQNAKQTVLLVDNEATVAEIRIRLVALLKTGVGETDTLVLFFGPHGLVDETRGGKGFILTHKSEPQYLGLTALPMEEVQGWIKHDLVDPGRTIIIVDVCRAGKIGQFEDKNLINSRFHDTAPQQRQVLGLLASKAGEVSVEGYRFGSGHGVFSYFLLRGLSGEADKNADQQINAAELYDWVREKVAKATNKSQTPDWFGTISSDTVLSDLKQGLSFKMGPLMPRRPSALLAQRQAAEAGESSRDAPGDRAADSPVAAAVQRFEQILQDESKILPDVPGGAFEQLELLEGQLSDRLAPTSTASRTRRSAGS